jgi:osmotically-inducible protein OsmY
MSVLTQVFGGKYNDEKLVSTVEQAIAVDPLLRDPSALIVASKKGVIQLTGKVHSPSEKERVESLIRTTLSHANVKYDKIVNDIMVV